MTPLHGRKINFFELHCSWVVWRNDCKNKGVARTWVLQLGRCVISVVVIFGIKMHHSSNFFFRHFKCTIDIIFVVVLYARIFGKQCLQDMH